MLLMFLFAEVFVRYGFRLIRFLFAKVCACSMVLRFLFAKVLFAQVSVCSMVFRLLFAKVFVRSGFCSLNMSCVLWCLCGLVGFSAEPSEFNGGGMFCSVFYRNGLLDIRYKQ